MCLSTVCTTNGGFNFFSFSHRVYRICLNIVVHVKELNCVAAKTDVSASFYNTVYEATKTDSDIFYSLQALCPCPGQLWHLQPGPASTPALQGRCPSVLPKVAGQDLCPERRQSNAAGHTREVRLRVFLSTFHAKLVLSAFHPVFPSPSRGKHSTYDHYLLVI